MIDNFPQLIGLGVCFGLFVGYLSLWWRNRYAPYGSVRWGSLTYIIGFGMLTAGFAEWSRFFSSRMGALSDKPHGSYELTYGLGLLIAVLAAAVSARAFGYPWRRELPRTIAECALVATLIFGTEQTFRANRRDQEWTWMQAESNRRAAILRIENEFRFHFMPSQYNLIKNPEKLRQYVNSHASIGWDRDWFYRQFEIYQEMRTEIPREFRTKDELEQDLDYVRLSALGSWLLAASILPWFMRRVRVPDKLPLYVRKSMMGSNSPTVK